MQFFFFFFGEKQMGTQLSYKVLNKTIMSYYVKKKKEKKKKKKKLISMTKEKWSVILRNK